MNEDACVFSGYVPYFLFYKTIVFNQINQYHVLLLHFNYNKMWSVASQDASSVG